MEKDNCEYLKFCLSLTPEERFRLGIELSEWSMKLNKHNEIEFNKRLEGSYLLI